MLDGEECADHVQFEVAFELGCFDQWQRADRTRAAGIGDDGVQRSVVPRGELDRSSDGSFVSDVGHHVATAVADGAGSVGEPRFGAPTDGDRSAFGGEGGGTAETDAGSPTGHQGVATAESL